MSLDKNLSHLNLGISTMIATFLKTKDLLNLCFINSRWVTVGNNSILWQSKFQKEWILFTSGKPGDWTYLKWVSYIDKNAIVLDKVGTLFTLTDGDFEDWDTNDLVRQPAIKFQWPVKTVDIFKNEIWVVDIYGGLSLICPNRQLDDECSKLWDVFKFCHLERCPSKCPIQNIVTLASTAIILYCNNECEIFFGYSNKPMFKYNVNQVGFVDGDTLYCLQNDKCLYQIRKDGINTIMTNVNRVFDETVSGILYMTSDNLLMYYDEDEYTMLCTIEDVHQISLISDFRGTPVLVIIDNMKKLKAYDFDRIKEDPGHSLTPNLSLARYEMDNISNVYTSSHNQPTVHFITVSNELLFVGNNNYPILYSASPIWTEQPVYVDSNVIKITDSGQTVAVLKQYGSD